MMMLHDRCEVVRLWPAILSRTLQALCGAAAGAGSVAAMLACPQDSVNALYRQLFDVIGCASTLFCRNH